MAAKEALYKQSARNAAKVERWLLPSEGGVSKDFTYSDLEHIHTQSLALNTCITLVSVEPKLTLEAKNHILKSTLRCFALRNDPADVVDTLINNLITLLGAVLLTSGKDGRSKLINFNTY